MAVFENFPYTNFHDMNMDWLLKKVKELSAQVAEFEELLATGPVVDVKTQVNGVSTSIKNGSGIANLPAASDTTDGVIGLDAVSDDVLRISGAETFDVPILNGGMIDESQLPPIVEPATSAAFGTVKVASTSTGVNVTSGDGTFTAAKLNGNGDVDASVIPDSGVTAGTYGTSPNYMDASYNVIWGEQVSADGRITSIHQNPVPLMRTDVATIAAGSYTASLYFDLTANYPWYNNACFANVNVYEYAPNAKGTYRLNALVHGTDYTYDIYQGYMNVTLTAAHSNPVYVCINGCYGRRSM